MKFYIKGKESGKMYEISELVTKASYEDRLNDGCSKLEFSYINNDLPLENGDEIRFEYDNLVFVGVVFKINSDKSREISITAYDWLRYAKGKDYFSSKGDTLTSLTKKMCLHFNFNQGSITDTGYTLATQVFDGDTWLDIVYSGINETLAYKKKWYVLRDEGGYITLRNISDLNLNLVLGDQSLCYDYEYEKSIDDNFYNRIIIVAKGKDENSASSIVGARSDSSIKKYGPMQYYESISNKTVAQAQDYADSLLSLYNEESKSLTLDCLGDSRIRAGNSIYGQIKDIRLDKRLVVRSVTHDFIPVHTMKIEVIL
jgi:hypothetical protein